MKGVAWLFLVLGGMFFMIGMWLVITASISASWPKVTGEIVDVKVIASIRSGSSPLNRYVEYGVEVDYEYDWQGQTHKNNLFSYGSGTTVKGGFNAKAEARAWLSNSEYQTGTEVTVFVNVDDVSQSVLSPGLNWSTFVPMVLSLLFGCLGYFLLRNSASMA